MLKWKICIILIIFLLLNEKFSLNFEIQSTENEKDNEKRTVGMIQLAFAYLFEQIKLRKDRGVYYVVTASYLEGTDLFTI